MKLNPLASKQKSQKNHHIIQDVEMASENICSRNNVCSKYFWLTIWNYFSEYCDNSTIHGVKYVGEKKRPLMERIWWSIIFLASIFVCFWFIWSSWKEWQESPVIIAFAGKVTPIWKIPFPAITICSEAKFKSESLDYETFTASEFPHNNLTQEEIHRLSVMYQTCGSEYIPYTLLHKSPITFNESFIETLNEMSQTVDDVFYDCAQSKNRTECHDFVPILTEEGFCFTHNILNASELYDPSVLHAGFGYPVHGYETNVWNREDGYKKAASMFTYPERGLASGTRATKWIKLQVPIKDFDYLCRSTLQGFKIHLHSPDEVPQNSKQYFHASLNQAITIGVKPTMLTTSDGLRQYDPSRRQCYFSHERKLKFFRIYTQKHCELECLSLFIKEKCGCVQYAMPREADTPICGIQKVDCYNIAELELSLMAMEGNLSKSSEKWLCNCLPDCTTITYDAETSQTNIELTKLRNKSQWLDGYLSRYIPVFVKVYFKDTHFVTSQRSELYSMINFTASCGGLLGLFMGVSILSVFEIIYFCSIRLYSNFRIQKRKNSLITKDIITQTSSKEFLNFNCFKVDEKTLHRVKTL